MLRIETILTGILGICVIASFLFALAESSLFSLGTWQIRSLGECPDPRGKRVQRLLEQSNDLLASIILGNAVSNAFIIAVSAEWARRKGLSIWLVGTVLFFLLLWVCEVTPKALAVRNPEAWALRVAFPMEVFQRITRSIRRLSQSIVDVFIGRWLRKPKLLASLSSEADYRDLIELGAQQGALGSREKEIIFQVLSLDKRTAGDVMKPRAQMVALRDDLEPAEMIRASREAKHHRIPLYDETPDTIVGLLNTRTLLLHPNVDVSEAIEFPSFVPESMNLLRLFEALQRQQRGMAMVVDEFGGTAGLVTMQDILEIVLGRIRGEGESQSFMMQVTGPGKWRISGSMRLDDFRREWPKLPDDRDVDTVGGLVVKLAEVVPPEGSVFDHGGLRFVVRIADQRRVKELDIEIHDRGARS